MDETTRPQESTQLSLHQLPICPHLGLRIDPTVVTGYATEQHACYNQKRRPTPTLEHQSNYCLAHRYGECSFYSLPTTEDRQIVAPPASQRKSGLLRQLIGVFILFLVLVASTRWVSYNFKINMPDGSKEQAAYITPQPVSSTPLFEALVPTASLPAADSPTATLLEALLPTVTPTPDASIGDAGTNNTVVMASDRFVTPTPEVGGQVLYLTPQSNRVAWWLSGDTSSQQIGDSFLYAGLYNEQSYISAVQFDLSQSLRGAPVRAATLRLTGLRNVDVTANTSTRWLVQLIAENELADLSSATFLSVFSAPAAITLLPEIQPSEIGEGRVNEWQLDQNVRLWLEQELLNGATSITVRIMASSTDERGVFSWDSGQGTESSGNAPGLLISFGPVPATPPPLPTKPVIVATLTPLPQNVMTAVAQSATTTAEAVAFGTHTPSAYSVVTPTSMPENLATVQANAEAQGLPAVVLNTPVPANAATAAADADFATAVALTTGTFTPVPTGYVTPVLLFPEPPAENVATAAARVVIATQEASSGLPMPTAAWNGVNAIYVYATPTPANAEIAAAQIREQNAAALATGTPTPTPWNLVVITAVPPPLPTEIPIIVPADQVEPTATAVPVIPATVQDLATFRGQILFLSDRTGQPEAWAMDATTGELLFLVRDARLHPLARELYLANSPDGTEHALVEADSHRDLQIKTYSDTYQQTTQVTNLTGATSYDPAWSPLGDRIAFVSTASGGDEIYTIDPKGNNLLRLTENAWEWDKHPSWSPDGTQIVFYSNRDSGRKQIWIMNADGSNQRNLSNDEFENWDPVWIR